MKDSRLTQWTDEQLLESINKGDHVAGDVLYQRHAAYAINLASRLVRNREQAKEIAQDAWLALHCHLKKHDPPAEFKPYLVATIVNRCRKILKKQQHEGVSLDAGLLAYLEGTKPHLIASEECVVRNVEREILIKAMDRSLRQLSEMEYVTLKLRHFDGRSYAEIANYLGKTEGHTRLIAHRALSALRTE